MSISLRNRRGGKTPRPREFYLEAGREYVRRYGADQLVAAAWNPAAAKRGGRPELLERYRAGREDGSPWPSLNSVKKTFKGFVAFREALGLPPNTTGGPRRKAGEAAPIFNVYERRIVVPDATTVWLRGQLDKAERRALRAEERLEAAKRRLAEAPTETLEKVTELRQRLQDERSRRREVQRELTKAERRDKAGVREVERLTERLAAINAQGPKVVTKTVTVPGKSRERTKTITRTVTVQDEKLLRQVEKLESRVAELRAENTRIEGARVELAERLADIRRDAIAEAIATTRVQEAERQVAELERKMAAQAELLVGERRQLTYEEVEKLRRDGPNVRIVFSVAVKRIVHAEGKLARIRAIDDAMVVLQRWKDQL